MLRTNNGEGKNPTTLRTSNGREDPINVNDLDFDGAGPGMGKTSEQIKADKVAAETLAAEKLAAEKAKENGDGDGDGNGDDDNKEINITELLKDVQNDYVKSLTESQITDSITRYKGAGFDKDGNVIDADGKVIKTPEEIKVDLEKDDSVFENVSEVTLTDDDGKEVKYKLNASKDAVDAEGKIIKTKSELVVLMSDEGDEGGETDYIKNISTSTGFIAVDEKDEPVTFENTVEGLAAREVHIVKQEANKLAITEINSFFDKNKDILEMMNYKKVHGSLKDFATHEDYTKVVLEDSNDEQHKAIIVKAEMAKGNSEARAKTVADLLMQDGKGKAEAEDSLKYLKDKQTNDQQASLDKIKVEEDVIKVERVAHFEKVAQVVSSGKVKGYTIPEFFKAKLPDGTETTFSRNAIFQLIAEPINDEGITRYDKLKSQDSVEDIVLDAYLRLVGYNVDQLVTQKTNNNNVMKLKDAKKRSSGKVILHKSTGPIEAADIA